MWHDRLGHAGNTAVGTMMSCDEYGMSSEDRPEDVEFETCVRAKHAKYPLNEKLVEHSKEITVHGDIYEPLRNRSLGRGILRKYDDYPHCFTKVHPIKSKVEATQHIFDFIAWIERNTLSRVKRVNFEHAK